MSERIFRNVETGWTGGPQRRIDAVGHVEVKTISAEAQTGVPVPAVRAATLRSRSRRVIELGGIGDRNEAVRIDGLHIRRAIRIAEEVEAFSFPVTQTAKGI